MEHPKLKVEDFTNHKEAQEVLKDLRDYFIKNEMIVSDLFVIDNSSKPPKELQFVNLVQEGGGVLGIGLVGYTWVLEKMGIRFYSLAGTSAGAINTLLHAAMGGPMEEKSEKLLDELCKKDLFDFIDGNWLAKALIRNIFTHENYISRLKNLLMIIFGTGILVPLIGVLVLGLTNIHDSQISNLKAVFVTLTLISWACIIGVGLIVFSLNKKFYRSGYGINPGKAFFSWIDGILRKYGANTVKNLKDILESKTGENDDKTIVEKLNLELRKSENDTRDLNDLPRRLAIITSDISIQTKIEFPDMAGLYWENVDSVNPAEFVRASMSIPVFFESYQVEIPRESKRVQNVWDELQNMEPDDIPVYARFVDGGMISNFPINIFHNPDQKVARLPTFGIRLTDFSEKKNGRTNYIETEDEYKTFGGYLWSMFNTVRYYYDKDFLLKNRLYNKSIGAVNIENFNWLNFNMSDQEKIRLFLRGVHAAKVFLMKFDWKEYKTNRSVVMQKIELKKIEESNTRVSV